MAIFTTSVQTDLTSYHLLTNGSISGIPFPMTFNFTDAASTVTLAAYGADIIPFPPPLYGIGTVSAIYIYAGLPQPIMPPVVSMSTITGLASTAADVVAFFTATDQAASVTALAALFSGADTLTGSTFDDTLAGFDGGDAIDGGLGADTVSYIGSAAGVTVNLLTGAVRGGDAAGDTLTSIENVTGSAFRDSLAGDAGANTLNGGDGDDTLSGGGDADRLNGGDGIDTISYARSSSGVQVNLGTGTGASGDAQGDMISGVEYLTGSTLGDTLIGSGDANRLLGLDGDDFIYGGGGGDTVKGDVGADWLFGEDGNDALNGDAGDDRLDGGDGADRLTGGDGADRLTDGAGRDAMTGGDGNDIFIFSAPDGSVDAIHDWTAGDKISIGFSTGTVVIGELVTGTDIRGAEGEGIFYNTANGRLYLFDSEEGVHTLFGVLANKPTDLAFSDFLIV